MNKDEIKKALECCRNGCPIGDCPYYGIKDCDNDLFKDTIELITEQEKEIEQLKTNISQAQDQILATAQKNQEYREQQIKQAKQETAREIIDLIVDESGVDLLGGYYKLPFHTYNKIKREYGVNAEELGIELEDK